MSAIAVESASGSTARIVKEKVALLPGSAVSDIVASPLVTFVMSDCLT
jgi:hypothetical protein